jgi:hypothetical protein
MNILSGVEFKPRTASARFLASERPLFAAAVTSVDGGSWQGHGSAPLQSEDPLYHPDHGLDLDAHLGFDPIPSVG